MHYQTMISPRYLIPIKEANTQVISIPKHSSTTTLPSQWMAKGGLRITSVSRGFGGLQNAKEYISMSTIASNNSKMM